MGEDKVAPCVCHEGVCWTGGTAAPILNLIT
jgi:hypothetical protein